MKHVLFLVCMGILTLGVQAQDVKFGIQAGVNLATVKGDYDENIETNTRFYAGLDVELALSETFSLQSGLQYSMQGFKSVVDNTDTGEYIKDVYKLGYLNLPIQAKYYVANGFSVALGPQIGVLLSAKDDWEYRSVFSGNDSGEVDVKDDIESLDYGVKFGLGYRFANGFNFGASYYLGLANIVEAQNFKNQNHVIHVGIGYYFK